MPNDTVYVGRPTKWGNPFKIDECRAAGYAGTDAEIAKRCVEAYRVWLGPSWQINWDGKESEKARQRVLSALHEIRGKNLACWCHPDQPCHADVLLELANGRWEQS